MGSLAQGRYVLGPVIGSGGMGLVYRASDQQLGRDVAVKLLADNLAHDADARERFCREAQAAARLVHPNVVQIFDVGEEDGRPWFVMELVPGASLADAIAAHGPLPATEVEDVAVQTLRGLDRAHASGLLHRDLKPANLLRAADGTVKVTDFGVAHATELPQLTRTGLVLGTLPYLAPERLTGAPASARTDLYALGATLLELLTGVSADRRRDPDGTIVPDAGDLGTVPPPLATLVHACLSRDPEDRPRSAAAALELLEGRTAADPPGRRRTEVLPVPDVEPTVVADVREVGPPARPPARPRARWARSRGRVRWVALGGLAVLAFATMSRIETRDGPAPADPAVTEPASPAPADTGPPAGGSRAETARNLAEWLRQQAD